MWWLIVSHTFLQLYRCHYAINDAHSPLTAIQNETKKIEMILHLLSQHIWWLMKDLPNNFLVSLFNCQFTSHFRCKWAIIGLLNTLLSLPAFITSVSRLVSPNHSFNAQVQVHLLHFRFSQCLNKWETKHTHTHNAEKWV